MLLRKFVMAQKSAFVLFLIAISMSVLVNDVVANAENEEKDINIDLILNKTSNSVSNSTPVNPTVKPNIPAFEEQELVTNVTKGETKTNSTTNKNITENVILVTTGSVINSVDLTTPQPKVIITSAPNSEGNASDSLSSNSPEFPATTSKVDVAILENSTVTIVVTSTTMGGSMTPFPNPVTPSSTTVSNNEGGTDRHYDNEVAKSGPPTWALVLIGLMITFSLVFTALFFTRKYCARVRREERRLLLRSQEGFFFGDTNGSFNNNQDRL